MSRKPTKRELDRLLARGRTARPEREAILDEVLRATAPRRRRGLGWWAARLALPMAAAAALLVVVPSVWRRSTPEGDGAFRAKGRDGGGPVVEAGCGGGCARGATLVFRVGRLDTPAWLAAWAVTADGERVWYFPSIDKELPRLPPSNEPQVVPRGVRLAGEGRLVVHTLLLRRPLDRAAIAALDGAAPDDVVLARAAQTLEVAP
jgi:hypothetical protein